MRKFFTYPVFLVLFLSFIGAMGFGAIVKYHYDGGEKYQFLQKPVMLISSVPKSLNRMIKLGTLNFDKPDPLLKHKDKKQFCGFPLLNKKKSFFFFLSETTKQEARTFVFCSVWFENEKQIEEMKKKLFDRKKRKLVYRYAFCCFLSRMDLSSKITLSINNTSTTAGLNNLD